MGKSYQINMKKIFTLICFTTLAFAAMAQYDVRNFSFENWSPNGTGMWPDQWEEYDSATTAQLGLLERRTGGSHGNYSIKLNCYEDGSFPTGAWLIMEDSIPFTPQAFALDYIIPPGSAFLTTIRVNIYFYDSAGEFISERNWNLTETSSAFKNGILPLGFTQGNPKSYAMDIKFQNIGGEAGDYVVVDNVRFLETYTPPPPPPTGLNEVKKAAFSIYPNPANQTLYIKNQPEGTQIAKIIGVDGKELKQMQAVDVFSGFDVAALPAGIYTLELCDATGVVLARNRFSKAD